MIYSTIILKIFEELALFSYVSQTHTHTHTKRFIYIYPYAHIRGGGRKLNIFSSGLNLKKNNPFEYLSTKKS